jgi:L-alanine-DL-glutamate epimerase-like enolase superfamily enzyme
MYPRPVHVLEVQLRMGDVIGFGEAAPSRRYGETPASAAAFLAEARELLAYVPTELEAIERQLSELPPGQMAARAALDAALHDLRGKLVGKPVWRLLGLEPVGPATSYTISLDDPDAMARSAEWVSQRFRRLKLKLGGRDGLDLERVTAVRGVTDLPASVDVNEGWSLEEALDLIPRLAALGVSMVEQPLPAGDPDGIRLKAASSLPIFLDEDCRGLADLPACAERGHGINVKLAKCGGIREALRLVCAARGLGLGLMIGCMLESSLGIAPAAQIASIFDRADLDGNLLLASDPWSGLGLVNGAQVPSERPGLGVRAVSGFRG